MAEAPITSRASKRFWRLLEALPQNVQFQAHQTYLVWRDNPRHPSLHFKKLTGSETRMSVRIGLHYRAIGENTDYGIRWVWIGSHSNYDKLTRR
jgi:hypothetical protein